MLTTTFRKTILMFAALVSIPFASAQTSWPLPVTIKLAGDGDAPDAVGSATAEVPGTAAPDALAGASTPGAAPGLHRAIGYASSGLLLAAGAVGAWRFLDLMADGHAYRDSLGIGGDGDDPLCAAEIASLWTEGSGQALRWTHVGLLAAGSALYAWNAVTGVSMFSPEDPGLSRRDLHRYAFFLHLGLMATEAALGFMVTDALSRGDHELVSELGPLHLALGAATPLVIAASGLVFTIDLGP